MESSHVDLLAANGLWLGIALVAGATATNLFLPVGVGRVATGGLAALAGVVTALQGVLLLSAPGRHVGRKVAPLSSERLELDNRANVYVLAAFALLVGLVFVAYGAGLLVVVQETTA